MGKDRQAGTLAHRSKSAPLKVSKVAKPKASRTAPHPLTSKRHILLCPGPVNLSHRVKTALAESEMCHREPEFGQLFQTTRIKLVHALGLGQTYTAVLIGGSGTAALEAAVIGAAEPGKKILVLNNGVYGSRLVQIARAHQIPCVEIRSPLTERPDLNRVAAALKRDPNLVTVAMVHHETSTGLINPVEEVGDLAKKFHRRFLVDAISSLGAEPLDLAKHHVGLCVGSAGKCLHGAVGLSFVLLSQEEARRIAKASLTHSLYLNLGMHLRAQEAGDLPFTPPVPLVAAFHAALDDLIRETLKVRIARYRERAELLRQGFKKLGLSFLLNEKLLSNTLTALWVPKEKTYAHIHDGLKKAGYVIYAGQSELRGKIFRVAHMGNLLLSDLRGFLEALKEVLRG
jgi:2-aminoethylphosphonate-pyruvate transaminase